MRERDLRLLLSREETRLIKGKRGGFVSVSRCATARRHGLSGAVFLPEMAKSFFFVVFLFARLSRRKRFFIMNYIKYGYAIKLFIGNEEAIWVAEISVSPLARDDNE